MIRKEIEKICNKYHSILKENIQLHVNGNKNTVEEYVQNLDGKIDIMKMPKDSYNTLGSLKHEHIYQLLNLLKQNAQISLNISQYPSLYSECQICETHDSSPRNEIYPKPNNFSNNSKEDVENNQHCTNIFNSTSSEECMKKLISTENIWLCKLCASENDYKDFKCKICDNCGPHYQNWRCENCTFINNKMNDYCKICCIKNPYIQRCKCKLHNLNNLFDKICETCDNDLCKSCKSIRYCGGLCYRCYQDKWICLNKLCKFVNTVELSYCEKCCILKHQKQDGVLKMWINNKQSNTLWQCSYKSCLHLNEMINEMCIRCDNKKHGCNLSSCFLCGWNNHWSTRCLKCHPV